jgi:hypothetical protein
MISTISLFNIKFQLSRRREQLIQAIYRNQNAIEKNLSKKGKGSQNDPIRSNNMYDFLMNVPRDGEENDDNEDDYGNENDEDENEKEYSEDGESQENGQNYGTENDESEFWLQKLVIPDGVSCHFKSRKVA